MLGVSGLLVTPVLPQNQTRTAIMAPISQVLSEIMGFKERSNGSAGLVLSAYMGFSQLNFMFLSAATPCFVGWSLLSENQQAEFGWFAWALAAVPAGVFTLFLIIIAIQIIFHVRANEQATISPTTLKTQLDVLGPLARAEWLSIGILTLALAGWLTKPLHGIKEAWIAVAALVAFMLTDGLNKRTLKNNIDWGYLLFLAVMLSLSSIIPYLKLDQWLTDALGPFLMTFSSRTTTLLIMVALLVYGVRFLLNKTSAVVLFMLVLGSWSQNAGIHPGVLLLTVLIALESWFLPYQTPSYQIAYYSTDEKAFSHAQARKLMIVKFIVSLLAIVISVPYWKLLGLVR
jgi:anion transporter